MCVLLCKTDHGSRNRTGCTLDRPFFVGVAQRRGHASLLEEMLDGTPALVFRSSWEWTVSTTSVSASTCLRGFGRFPLANRTLRGEGQKPQ